MNLTSRTMISAAVFTQSKKLDPESLTADDWIAIIDMAVKKSGPVLHLCTKRTIRGFVEEAQNQARDYGTLNGEHIQDVIVHPLVNDDAIDQELRVVSVFRVPSVLLSKVYNETSPLSLFPEDSAAWPDPLTDDRAFLLTEEGSWLVFDSGKLDEPVREGWKDKEKRQCIRTIRSRVMSVELGDFPRCGMLCGLQWIQLLWSLDSILKSAAQELQAHIDEISQVRDGMSAPLVSFADADPWNGYCAMDYDELSQRLDRIRSRDQAAS